MRRGNTVIIFIIFLFIAGTAWLFVYDPQFLSDAGILQNVFKEKSITIHGTIPLSVIVADTDELRVKGLSGRTSLATGHGLLMVFPQDQRPGIWMKDMKFAIDIIWIDSNGNIVTIYSDVDPNTYPKVFYPDTEARYVLELDAGYTDIHNIAVGDHVAI